MVLGLHDLRRHVARRSRIAVRVIFLKVGGSPEVYQVGHAFLVENNVLGLDVPVDDVQPVERLQRLQHRKH